MSKKIVGSETEAESEGEDGGGGSASEDESPSKKRRVESSAQAFDSLKVVSLAQDRNIEQVRALSLRAIKMVSEIEPPVVGWRKMLPTWIPKKKKKGKITRGLKAWVKDKGLCNTWIHDAINFYTMTIGVPPVITGVKRKKKTKKSKGPRGHTRGQTPLSKVLIYVHYISLHITLCYVIFVYD